MRCSALFVSALVWLAVPAARSAPLVLQTDFGTKDGAVAAMKGVALGVDPKLTVADLSHENTPYDIWEAAFRLKQTAAYWPAGTVFVSVVDPGVGTERKSIVLLTNSGHLFVSPDNGTLTLVAEDLGVKAVRTIDETQHRRTGSAQSYTFHGRDVYAFTGAKLAAGTITFAQVGPELKGDLVRLAYEKARREGDALVGTIPSLDERYGNIWTNIGEKLFAELKPKAGDRFRVRIAEGDREVFVGDVPYANTFGDVPKGAPLLYLNSLMDVSFALNLRSFAAEHGVKSGAAWHVRVERTASAAGASATTSE